MDRRHKAQTVSFSPHGGGVGGAPQVAQARARLWWRQRQRPQEGEAKTETGNGRNGGNDKNANEERDMSEIKCYNCNNMGH
jgi:poly(3-hydroxybutyrate) depolymerase